MSVCVDGIVAGCRLIRERMVIHSQVGYVITALLLVSGRAVGAQTIVVSGNPGALVVSSAIAGSQPPAVSHSSTTYTVVTPNPSRTYAITAQLDIAMPVGTTLTATLAAPPGATSLGPIALDMTPRNVVTGIPRRTSATQNITYQFTATVSAGVVPPSARAVTLTIVQFP
jgi:hypothetical protein